MATFKYKASVILLDGPLETELQLLLKFAIIYWVPACARCWDTKVAKASPQPSTKSNRCVMMECNNLWSHGRESHPFFQPASGTPGLGFELFRVYAQIKNNTATTIAQQQRRAFQAKGPFMSPGLEDASCKGRMAACNREKQQGLLGSRNKGSEW